MAWENIRIEKAPDDSDGIERFYIVQFDAAVQATQLGHITDTKGPLPEAVIRDFLKVFGCAEHQVDAMFRAARAKDKPSGN